MGVYTPWSWRGVGRRCPSLTVVPARWVRTDVRPGETRSAAFWERGVGRSVIGRDVTARVTGTPVCVCSGWLGGEQWGGIPGTLSVRLTYHRLLSWLYFTQHLVLVPVPFRARLAVSLFPACATVPCNQRRGKHRIAIFPRSKGEHAVNRRAQYGCTGRGREWDPGLRSGKGYDMWAPSSVPGRPRHLSKREKPIQKVGTRPWGHVHAPRLSLKSSPLRASIR